MGYDPEADLTAWEYFGRWEAMTGSVGVRVMFDAAAEGNSVAAADIDFAWGHCAR
jgi:hypothetical protein